MPEQPSHRLSITEIAATAEREIQELEKRGFEIPPFTRRTILASHALHYAPVAPPVQPANRQPIASTEEYFKNIE